MAKILVVDDESALVGAKDDPPDCILLDVMMPGLGGCQTCEALKADPALARIPVQLVSATTDFRVVDRAEQVGASAVLPKPVPAEELQHAVALALATPPSA